MGNQERALQLFIVLSRASKVVLEESSKLIVQYGLNTTEFGVLELLYHKGQQPIQKIGQKILLQSGSMTYVINRLQEKEFVQRIYCEDDKRVTYIAITEKGTKLIESIFPMHAEKIEDIMGVLTIAEQEEAIKLIKKLGLSLKDLSD